MNKSIIDLPQLNSIKLGKYALCGLASFCSLKMESDFAINELIFRSSESNIDHFEWI